MSQSMGMASGSRAGSSKAMPVLLLALAVALTTALLHGLDNSPTATEASLAATQTAQESAVTPTTTATATTIVAARQPSEIKVLIANGTTTSGAAAKLNSLLVPVGYQLGTPGNTVAPMPETSVQYQTGFEAEARGVATALGLSEDVVRQMTDPAPIADTQGANVVVVMGDALATSTNANVAAPATTVAPSNALNGPLGNLSTATTVAGQSATGTASASGGSATNSTGSAGQGTTATTTGR